MRRIARYFVCFFLIVGSCVSFLSFTTQARQSAKEYIISGLFEMAEQISLAKYDLGIDEMSKIWRDILKSQPYLFFVDSVLELDVSEEKVIKVYPRYVMTVEQTARATEFCRSEIERMVGAAVGMTEREKALFLHDYLCLQFTYDESLESDNMYSFLKSGKGTCQGYALTYMAALQGAGLECGFAASDSMSHIWNTVRVEGEWYHVDVTWDDYPEVWGGVEHSNFLKSDKAITATAHRDWIALEDVKCVSEAFDAEVFISPLHKYISSSDVNCDGEVNIFDAVLFLMQTDGCLPDEMLFLNVAADADGDGELTENDLCALLDSILG